mmetsp:Transcript_26802/g.86548  ORF Transcript_26802/g.86548 Transcript_26802/m.86548 type:complete len:252 (-) Transcript_26802:1712-2467(-)
MREAVPLKHMSITSLPKPTASKIWAPRYDWTVQIPILDMTLRMALPADLRYVIIMASAVELASPWKAETAAYAPYGQMPSAPKPSSVQKSCGSLASPESTSRPVMARAFAATRRWWTAPVASSDGMGTRSGPAARCESTSSGAPPCSTAASALAERSTSASRKAVGDALATSSGKVASSVVVFQPLCGEDWRAAISVRVSTGCGRMSRRACASVAASTFASGPTGHWRDMTTSSRIGSMGGLVTCAKSCLK